MSDEKYYLPKHLDAPPRFLLWSIDDALVVLLPLFLGGILGLGFLTLVLAVICGCLWKKIKGSGGINLIKAIIYWYYPAFVLGLRKVPDSSVKYYIS